MLAYSSVLKSHLFKAIDVLGHRIIIVTQSSYLKSEDNFVELILLLSLHAFWRQNSAHQVLRQVTSPSHLIHQFLCQMPSHCCPTLLLQWPVQSHMSSTEKLGLSVSTNESRTFCCSAGTWEMNSQSMGESCRSQKWG